MDFPVWGRSNKNGTECVACAALPAHQADVADMAAAVGQALYQLLNQFRAGEAAVPTHRNVGFALGQAL